MAPPRQRSRSVLDTNQGGPDEFWNRGGITLDASRGTCAGQSRTFRPLGRRGEYRRLDGTTDIGFLAGRGDASPIGRWALGFNPVPSKVGSRGDYDLYQMTGYDRAGTLIISPNGTWSYAERAGVVRRGNWSDRGNNIVELRGFRGQVQTASVWQCEIKIVSPVDGYLEGLPFR